MITEFCLFMGLTAKRSLRPWLLVAGFGLHLGIAVLMGLWSFSLAMMGCLVLYLRPLDLPVLSSIWSSRAPSDCSPPNLPGRAAS